ncbi:hypothetical protein D3C76_1419240 [compost metagenome]
MEAVRKFIVSLSLRISAVGSLAIFSKFLTVSSAACPVAFSKAMAATAMLSNASFGMRVEAASWARTAEALPTVPPTEETCSANPASWDVVVPAVLLVRARAVLKAVVSSLPCLYARARTAAAAAATVNGLTRPRT